MPRWIVQSDLERFQSSCLYAGDCIIWTSATRKGYGNFWYQGKHDPHKGRLASLPSLQRTEDTMSRYLVYFRGTDPYRAGNWIKADSSLEARQLFAKMHEVPLSSYIAYTRKGSTS